MPIVQPKPTAPPAKEPLQVQVAEPRYQQQTPIVDGRYTPSATILQYVEGSSWSVNYYSQIVGLDSELGPQQVDQAAVYQQYCLIQDMEIKVSTPLTRVQDTTSNSFEVTGAATTFPRMIPNQGDMFLADIGDGRMGLFTITLAEKKSYHKDALYNIEYKLVEYADAIRMADLEHKTIKKTIFRKDFLQFGQNPQVLAEDFEFLIKFEDAFGDLLGNYLHDFFSREYQTLLIPDQATPSYDPFLTKSLLDWVSTDENPLIARIKMPRVTGDQAMIQTTVWDCLSRMSKNLLPTSMYRAKLLNTIYFKGQPQMTGIFYTGLQNVMYPLDNRTDVDAAHEEIAALAPVSLAPGKRRYTDFQRLLDEPLDGLSYVATGEGLPDIVKVDIDDFYVFSESFYRSSARPFKSNLEKLVMDGLEEKALDKQLLSQLIRNAPSWGNLERFYYIPALLALIKVAIRTN